MKMNEVERTTMLNRIDKMEVEIADMKAALQVDENPVPWYEQEWETHQPNTPLFRVDVLRRTSEKVTMIATAWDSDMLERIMGMQKLVAVARWHASSGRSYQTAMREALEAMGV